MKKYPIFEHINHNRYILIFLCDILALLRNRQINEGCFLCLFDLLLWYIMSKCWVIFALRRNNSEFLQLLQSSPKQGIKRPITQFSFYVGHFSFYALAVTVTLQSELRTPQFHHPSQIGLYSSAIQKSKESSKTDFSSYSSSCPLKNSPPYN